MFSSLHFVDPVWEFQMLRSLVERAPVPLLGLVLVETGKKFADFKVLILGKSCGWGVIYIVDIGRQLHVSDRGSKTNCKYYNSAKRLSSNRCKIN